MRTARRWSEHAWHVEFGHTWCAVLIDYVDSAQHVVSIAHQVCEDIFKQLRFEVAYDFLIVATGCKTNTFNTPGVAEREGKFNTIPFYC